MATAAITQNLVGLGPYRITNLLGFNGMFATFKATDPQTDLPTLMVAVQQSFIAEADAWNAFQREFVPLIGAAASLVCQPRAFGNDAGHYWATYEWMAGSHLGVRVRDHGLPSPPQAFDWIAQAAEALAYLHAKGLRHQIINPASIFLNDLGKVKLLHVGWGHLIRGATGGGILNPAFSCILPFVAPEMADGRKIDEAADVYALGGNLYYLLTGYPPFWDDDPATLARLIVEEEPPLERLNGLLSREGRELIEEMLQKSPGERVVNLPALSGRLAAAVQTIEVYLARKAEATPFPDQPTPQETPVGQVVVEARRPQRTMNEAVAQSMADKAAAAQAADDAQPPTVTVLAERVAPARKTKKGVFILAAGVLLLVLAGIAIAAVSLGVFSPNNKRKTATNPAQTGTGSKAVASPEQTFRNYELTATRLRALGLLSKGFHRQNGRWPVTMQELEALGAKPEECMDAWKQAIDLRENFTISAGADMKWDTTDDVWYDAAKAVPGGHSPPAPLPKPK